MLVFRNRRLIKLENASEKLLRRIQKMYEEKTVPIMDEKKRQIGIVKNIHYSKALNALVGDLVFEKGPFYTGYKTEFKFVKKALQITRIINTNKPPSKKYILKWRR